MGNSLNLRVTYNLRFPTSTSSFSILQAKVSISVTTVDISIWLYISVSVSVLVMGCLMQEIMVVMAKKLDSRSRYPVGTGAIESMAVHHIFVQTTSWILGLDMDEWIK